MHNPVHQAVDYIYNLTTGSSWFSCSLLYFSMFVCVWRTGLVHEHTVLWRFGQICSGPVVGEMSPQNQHVQLFFPRSDEAIPQSRRPLLQVPGSLSDLSVRPPVSVSPPSHGFTHVIKWLAQPAAQTGLNRALRLDINFCSSAPLSFLAPISSAYLSPLSAEPPGRPGQTLPLMCSK